VLLDGDEALRDRAVDELRWEGISYLVPGRSHKPADNGKHYKWYIRVGYAQEHPSAQRAASALARVQGLVPDKPEVDQKLLRHDRELAAKVSWLQELLEAERSRIRMAARLRQGEEERRFLVERSSVQYKELTEAIAALRVDNQRLSSTVTEQQQRAHDSPPSPKNLGRGF
jgi:hypothetical protein